MHHLTLPAVLLLVSNIVIALGYFSMPFFVLRYLPLTRTALLWGAGFFAGCGGTHIGMSFLHAHTGWLWVAWHIAQAICTWGFILTFSAMLRVAHSRRQRASAAAGGAP